jgi:hypothetical protein
MRSVGTFLAVLLLAGCGSAAMRSRTYGPDRGGVVEFKGNGEAHALAMAARHCHPQDYRVVASETPHTPAAWPTTVLTFRCIDASTK